ncbi:cytochrome P450 [Virgibacillus indicus]|uniref:Cytochrome P450 n=1 Tax=Virgibacillus indicus TaxID=2024554 RepID=A0A265NCV2_9BACI|nr:cytochrome P450 [Virgibacillus indicus]OZU89299.1 cytochrome P450 [Virgibacillus indicus]
MTSLIPQEKGIDHTLALLSEGFRFIPNRLRNYDTDIFQTRLLGQKVICISGKEAANVFYDNELFQRKDAAPKRIQKTLFGEGGVQGMDDAAHSHRKELFMSLMTPERLQVLNNLTNEHWEISLDKWQEMDQIILFHEAEELMCRVACRWAGVPLKANELKQRTEDLSAMIDAFGASGPRHLQGRTARRRSEAWIKFVITKVRTGKWSADEDTALYKIAWHEDPNGNLLDLKTAAVELLNILRPIVAIGRYITFGALALHEHPETREKLQSDTDNYSQMFVQEVRRFYPFGPFLGARVRKDFTWNQHDFQKGTLVLLDIYGANHSSELWENPEQFRPERFHDWEGSPFDFIPQGGGDYLKGHRCAGEWITIEAMKTSLSFLVKQIDYEVPDQDLSYSMVRMPTIPKSRFVIRNIRGKQ